MTPLVDWPIWAVAFIAYVFLQRMIELVIARRNTARLLKEGGEEFGRRGYPLFIILHTLWLLCVVALAVPGSEPPWLLFALFVAVQGLRYWALATLGRWWTTRLVSAPDFPRVKRGPYRFLSHPNYLVVVLEIALVPLILNEVTVAVVFSILNAMLLFWRIRMENSVLARRGGLDAKA